MSTSHPNGFSPAEATDSGSASNSFKRSLLLCTLAVLVVIVVVGLTVYLWLVPKLEEGLHGLIVHSDSSFGSIGDSPLYEHEGNLPPSMGAPKCISSFPTRDATCPNGRYG
jgi:hypothetical protein